VKNVALLFLLTALPLAAGGHTVEVGLLLGRAQARANDITFGNSSTAVTYRQDPSQPTTLGLRLGLDLGQIRNATFQGTATWQPMARTDLELTSEMTFQGNTSHGAGMGRYGYGYAAAGGRVTWMIPMGLGIGFEVRSEKVENTWELNPAASARLTRPWLTLQAGHGWVGEALSPFVRLEFNLAMTRAAAPDPENPEAFTKDLIRSTAPNSHLMLVGGLRF
jgi:hypothetical protein